VQDAEGDERPGEPAQHEGAERNRLDEALDLGVDPLGSDALALFAS